MMCHTTLLHIVFDHHVILQDTVFPQMLYCVMFNYMTIKVSAVRN